jgi:hypothetical protein
MAKYAAATAAAYSSIRNYSVTLGENQGKRNKMKEEEIEIVWEKPRGKCQ